MFLLELGAGQNPYEDGRGWLHSDIRPGPDIEIVCPAEDIFFYLTGSGKELTGSDGEEIKCWFADADEIRATHLLEHFSYTKTVEVLKNWWAALKPGGSLYIEVPNARWQVNACANGDITMEEFVYYAYGEQNYEFNFHYAAFDEGLLRSKLMMAGFSVVGLTDIGQVLCAKAIKSSQ
jgi:hypothetical protein